MNNDTKKGVSRKYSKNWLQTKKVLLVLRGVCSYTMNEQGQYLFASVTQSQNLHSSWAAVLLSNTNPNYTKNAYFYWSDTNFAQQYCCIFLLCYLQRKISTISFLQKVVTNVSLLAIIFVPSSKNCSIVSRIVTILFGNGSLNQVIANSDQTGLSSEIIVTDFIHSLSENGRFGKKLKCLMKCFIY